MDGNRLCTVHVLIAQMTHYSKVHPIQTCCPALAPFTLWSNCVAYFGHISVAIGATNSSSTWHLIDLDGSLSFVLRLRHELAMRIPCSALIEPVFSCVSFLQHHDSTYWQANRPIMYSLTCPLIELIQEQFVDPLLTAVPTGTLI